MASEAPSWADQWGAGGIGALEENDNRKINKEEGSKKTTVGSSVGLGKAKAVAIAGARKIKTGTFVGIKWIKQLCQKKK
ncbi:hypothetical protein U1Q18_008890 [Sarracenia purpurea var. burkii]